MYAWFGYRLPLEERLRLIAQAGFTTTCLWLGGDEDLVVAGKADSMPLLAREAGLSLDNVHAPFAGCNGLWSDSPEAVAAVVDSYARSLEYCQRHGVPRLVVHVSQSRTPPPPTPSGLDALGRLVARAEKLGVTLAVENTRSPGHTDFVLAGIGSRHLGLCYDSSHDFISGQVPCRLLRQWGTRLVTTHLSDNHGVNDDHYLPGEGSIDWDLVQTAFPRAQYTGALMLEVVPEDSGAMPPEEFVRLAYGKALEMRARLGDDRSATAAEPV